VGSSPQNKGDESSLEVKSKKFILILVPSLLFSFYYLLNEKLLEALISLLIGIAVLFVLRHIAKKRVKTKIDYTLTTAIFHMYGLSLGETSPSDLVNTIAENKEYEFYSEVFHRIRNLAKDFGFGLTRATAQVASTVKPPLKDILVRCTNMFSSVEPKGYLEMESSMLMEEYSGYYTRAMETLKTLGGIFTTFQSITVFLILTLVIMTIFMIDPSAIVFGYIIAILATVMMYFLFRSASPREQLIYIGKYPPKLYSLMRWSLLATVPSFSVLAFFLNFAMGPPFAFIVLGLGAIIPGVFGYMLETYVNRINKNYPTFLKALGENLASTSNLKASLSYILYMELGPLRKLVKEALARVKLGIDHGQALETLSSEAASYQVHMSNRILLDSLSRGANALVIGNALGNRVVKFLEFRKVRDIAAKSFQTIVLVMQPMTVILLIILEVLAGFMSQYLINLPYFGFNEIPMVVIETGNIIVVFVMALTNALIVKEVSAGYWGTFFLNFGLLLVISGVTWMAGRVLIQGVLGSMPSIELPV
jgi:archaellum biogenesis protein FlaJ (TadC family)